MRILHVYRTYFPDSQGGLEEVIRQICLSTATMGHESRVFTISKSARPEIVKLPEGEVHRAKQLFEIASCNVSLGAFRKFRQLSRWADVVHYHFPWPFADVLHLTCQPAKPSLVSYHSDVVRQRALNTLYRPLRNRFLNSVDRIVCTSSNYFATSSVLSKFADKVDVIPIGIDEATYPCVTTSLVDEVKSRYGDQFFLFVGVLRYYKGLHILLDAIANAPFRVVIAGSGPTEKELKAQAERLGLTNVDFTGYVPNDVKVALFKLARAIVFPSYLRSEAFGVTLLEGAMYRKPLISTEVGSGTSHVNIDQETGLVVPPGSAKSLRAAMDELLNNQELARSMGANARSRYEQLFSAKLMGERYECLYQNLVSRRS